MVRSTLMLILIFSPVAILLVVVLIQVESSGISRARLREISEIPFYLLLVTFVSGCAGWLYKRLLKTNNDSLELAKLFDWLVSSLLASSALSGVFVLIYFFLKPRPISSSIGEISTSPQQPLMKLWLSLAILFFAASWVFTIAQKANKKLQ